MATSSFTLHPSSVSPPPLPSPVATVQAKVRRVPNSNTPAGAPTGAATPPPSPDLTTLLADIEIARKIAILLDSKFNAFGIRFGFDPILGMLPFVGDGVTAILGSYTIYLAHKHRLGKRVILAMLANLAFDWAVGSIPAVGDLFDVAFKAHLRNLALLERATKKL